MESKKFGNMYVVRVDRGEEIIGKLKEFARENHVKLGSVSGIGAVNSAVIGLFDTSSKKYISSELSGDFEITSLAGNISTMDGEAYIHMHACLSDVENKTLGGHLNSAIVSATAEIFINTVDGEVDRKFNNEIGLNLIKF